MFKIFLILVLSINSNSFAQTKWKLKKKSHGIQIYTRAISNHNFEEYKAITTLNTSLQTVLKALLEAPKYHKNCNPGVSYYVKSIKNNQHVFYAQKALPWPIKDRDIVTLLTVEKLSDKKIKLHLEGLPQEVPEKKETIRIKTVMGHWLLEEKENKTKVTQQLFLDHEFVINRCIFAHYFRNYCYE